MFAGHRHQQHIAQIRHARTAQVRVAEAVDHAVAVVIAAATVPIHVAIGASIGAELHQSIWYASAGEGVAVATGADEGVDEIAGGVGGLGEEEGGEEEYEEYRSHAEARGKRGRILREGSRITHCRLGFAR